MPTVELIPLDQGNRLILDQTIVTTIGRTPNIGCLDKKISRNHAELHIKSDGTLWIKPIHHNPTFFKTKTGQLVTLTKDKEFELHDGDEFGLLPNEYFYRIAIESTDKTYPSEDNDRTIETDSSPVENTSTRPKSPVEKELLPERSPVKNNDQEKILSPVKQDDEDELSSNVPADEEPTEKGGGVILHTHRALPDWMSNSSAATSKPTKGRGSKAKASAAPPPPVKNQTYVARKKAEGIVYDDDSNHDLSDQPTNTPVNNDPTSSTVIVVDPTKRERCPYGKFCYRKNPIHRQQAIHPGDPDWDNKENDSVESQKSKPECPYGTDCYRKNPDHLEEYSHNRTLSSLRKTKRRTSKRKGDDDEDDGEPNEYDYDDSFIDDDDSVHNNRADSDSSEAWKPHKNARQSDDNENDSSDESEIELLKHEADEFVQGSVKKKARVQNDDDDDE